MTLRRGVLAVVLLAAAAAKFIAPEPLLPAAWRGILPSSADLLPALLLGLVEVVVAWMLLGRRWRAGLVANAWLVLCFLAWQCLLLLIGERSQPCGCFGRVPLGEIPHAMVLSGYTLLSLSCLLESGGGSGISGHGPARR